MNEELKRIEAVLEEKVRPSLHAHGGEIQIDHLEEGVLYVKLLGQCAGCPSADLTNETVVEAELTAALEEARRQADSLSRENGAIRTEIEGRISELQQQMDRLDRDLGRRAMLDYAKERMEALRQEARESGQQLEELDKLLFLCDEFSRCKVRYIEDQINGRFRLVRWKLFQEQVNGGLADCCEATVDGVPYQIGRAHV